MIVSSLCKYQLFRERNHNHHLSKHRSQVSFHLVNTVLLERLLVEQLVYEYSHHNNIPNQENNLLPVHRGLDSSGCKQIRH